MLGRILTLDNIDSDIIMAIVILPDCVEPARTLYSMNVQMPPRKKQMLIYQAA
jgi:hypothetical protein